MLKMRLASLDSKYEAWSYLMTFYIPTLVLIGRMTLEF